MITLELPQIDIASLKMQCDWLNNKDVVRYSEQRHKTHTVNSQIRYVRSFLDHPDNVLREIHLNGLMIGSISAYIDKYNRIADVGILIGPHDQRRGYGYEAWSMFCNTLFENCSIRRIEGGCMAANTAMIKLFRKFGMQEEGRRAFHFIFEGDYSDMVLYGRIK